MPDPVLVGYLPGLAVTRRGHDVQTVPRDLTHLVYAFAKLKLDGNVWRVATTPDDETNFAKLRALKGTFHKLHINRRCFSSRPP